MPVYTYGPGTHIIAAPLVYSGPDKFVLQGAGSEQTTLVWTGTGTMIDVTYTEMSAPPTITGCQIVTRGYATDTAIKITGPNTGGIGFDSPLLEDLDIYGENPLTQCWLKGIKLKDVWYPLIKSIWITGLGSPAVLGSPPFPMVSAIEFERTQVLNLEDFHCFYVQDAVLQLDTELGEGQLIQNCEIVGVNRGVVLRSMGGTAIRNGHINAWSKCIDLDGKLQIAIHDMLLYKWFQSNLSWTAIYALNAVALQIHHNTICGNPGATNGNIGIFCVGVDDSQITNNIMGYYNANAANYGIVIGSACDRNMVSNNQIMPGCGACVTFPGGVGTNWNLNNKP